MKNLGHKLNEPPFFSVQQHTLLVYDIFQIELLYVNFRASNWDKRKNHSQLLQLIVKLFHEGYIVALAEALRPALLCNVYSILIILGYSRIDQIGTY